MTCVGPTVLIVPMLSNILCRLVSTCRCVPMQLFIVLINDFTTATHYEIDIRREKKCSVLCYIRHDCPRNSTDGQKLDKHGSANCGENNKAVYTAYVAPIGGQNAKALHTY